jgi:hypothetical protein
MAALLNALDTNTTKSIGENGHVEYSWSPDFSEKIVQLSFQMTRCGESQSDVLSNNLRTLLVNLKARLELIQNQDKKSQTNIHFEEEKFIELLVLPYKMIGHTRDIVDGKGECSLSYMQIFTWNQVFPELAKFALLKFVTNTDNEHPFGSWKDIKYFCNYCKTKGMLVTDPLIQYAFKIVIDQLHIDMTSDKKSLAAKWIPRAKSQRFGWIFDELAVQYFDTWIKTAVTPVQMTRAINKCKMSFRKLLAELNLSLGTVQINQCSNNWAAIDHAKTTSVTTFKQKKAFLNITKKGEQRSELEDRIQCADNFKSRIKQAVAGEVEMKGKRIGLNSFTEQANQLIKRQQCKPYYEDANIVVDIQPEIDLLNMQWKNNAGQTGTLCNMIAMLDFSGSMSGDPINAAMALGCRVAEKSILGRRVLSFSNNPTWHNLDGHTDFVDMIRVLQSGEVGYSTNFYKAFDVVLDAIIAKKLAPEEVEDIVLGIFSDMQINDSAVGAPANMNTFYDEMVIKYAEAGMRVWGKPYKPPHILFWNLRSTSGFPALSSQKNVSMMSGFNPALLNTFCEKGIEAFTSCTPLSVLTEQLSNMRYDCLEKKIKDELLFYY